MHACDRSDKQHMRTPPLTSHPVPTSRECTEVGSGRYCCMHHEPIMNLRPSHPSIHPSRDWGAIFRESSRVLYEEVDYTREGKNAERFSNNFKGTEWIKAPDINWSRSTSKVSGKRQAACLISCCLSSGVMWHEQSKSKPWLLVAMVSEAMPALPSFRDGLL